MFLFLAAATLLVAFANGANDNFKGSATLFGSGLTRFWPAMIFATVATLAGSGLAIFLAEQLLSSFSGKGLVESALTADVRYAASVAFAAGTTVLLATRVGMPVSTTHALIGGLLGAALAADATIDWQRLGAKFALPLLVSPILAFAMTGALTFVSNIIRHLASGPNAEDDSIPTSPETNDAAADASSLLDGIHWVSAGAVSFARGVNDTPKMAALFLLWPSISKINALLLVGAAIAVGGLLAARKVAETLSHRITQMTPQNGVLANLATTAIVLSASRFGLPVSTTHVSGSALIGLGVITGGGRWRMIGLVALAWLLTVPAGMAIGYMSFLAVSTS